MTYTIFIAGLMGKATAIDADRWRVDIEGSTIIIEPTTTVSDRLIWGQVDGIPNSYVQDIGEAIEVAAM